MVQQTVDDKAFQRGLDAEIASKGIAKVLFATRCAAGLSQTDVAKRLGWTRSKVSRLERTPTDSIRLGDVAAYACAIHNKASISLTLTLGEGRAVDSIKMHALQIKKNLDELVVLAKKDEQLAEGVEKFFVEAIWNIGRLFEQSAAKLPSPSEGEEAIQVRTPVLLPEPDEAATAGSV